MKVIDICDAEDLSFARVQRALERLHEKGQIEGFVPGSPTAEIKISRRGLIYMHQHGELNGGGNEAVS